MAGVAKAADSAIKEAPIKVRFILSSPVSGDGKKGLGHACRRREMNLQDIASAGPPLRACLNPRLPHGSFHSTAVTPDFGAQKMNLLEKRYDQSAYIYPMH